MTEPQRPYIGVHLLLVKDDKLLLMKRKNQDESFGKYALVAGKADLHESPTNALAREVYEEIGIHILPEDLEHVVTIHYNAMDYKAQKLDVVEFYFMPKKWEGTPSIKEPHKAEELDFYPLDNLPSPLPGGLPIALAAWKNGIRYIER